MKAISPGIPTWKACATAFMSSRTRRRPAVQAGLARPLFGGSEGGAMGARGATRSRLIRWTMPNRAPILRTPDAVRNLPGLPDTRRQNGRRVSPTGFCLKPSVSRLLSSIRSTRSRSRRPRPAASPTASVAKSNTSRHRDQRRRRMAPPRRRSGDDQTD